MKKYIREMIDDLKRDKGKDFIPPVPAPAAEAKTVDLDTPPAPVAPCDLNNQELSGDPAEETKQLDFQAQKNEERETS